MTCQELRLYFEDPQRRDAKLRDEAEHLVHCPECARFVEAQRELGAGLHLVRESLPQFPAGLDDAVLANYRNQVAERKAPVPSPFRGRFAVLCWSAAGAALVLVFVGLLWHSRKTVVTAQPQSAQATAAPAVASTVASAPPQTKPKAARRIRRPLTAPRVTSLAGPLPPGFRSLMYCDVLSCGGTMEVIRVQLPPSAVTFAPVSGSGGGSVFADVLVGPDGIARAIRVVE